MHLVVTLGKGFTHTYRSCGWGFPYHRNQVFQLLCDTASKCQHIATFLVKVNLGGPIYCRTQNVSGHFNLAIYSESILSLTFSNANKNVLML